MKKMLLLLFGLIICKTAAANISIYPYYLDFEAQSRKRIQSVRVINASNKRQTYRVSVVDLVQDEKGQLKEVDSHSFSAKKYLQFSPKQFTLEPNLVQTINIAKRGLGEAEDNEFFSFLQVSEVKLGEPEKKKSTKKNSLSLELIPLFSVRIPIRMVKGNDLIRDTKVVSHHVSEKGDNFIVELERTGNISSNVNLSILDEENEKIAQLNSIKIYQPNKKLTVNVPLTKKINFGVDKLRLEDAFSKEEISVNVIQK